MITWSTSFWSYSPIVVSTGRRPDGGVWMVESSRRLFELDPGVEIEAGDGWLFGAGRSTHPVISNAAFRLDDGLDPDELLARARTYFADRERGFAVWARAGTAEDADLIDAAERDDLRNVYEMPEMVLEAIARDAGLRCLATSKAKAGLWAPLIAEGAPVETLVEAR